MIELLERLAAAERAAPPVLDERSARLLEWGRITDQIARRCLDGRAAAAVRGRLPLVAPDAIELRRRLADELRPAGEVGQWPPLADLGGLTDLLEQAPPIRLEGPDLVQVAAGAEDLDRLRAHLLAAREQAPLWGEAAVQMAAFSGLSGALRRALDPDGRIVDGASSLLARLRRSLGDRERAVRQETAGALAEARRRGWTTGEEAVLRGDRFCLPLRSGEVRRVPGIVHDRSASGATLFVEPASVVRLANELAETRLEIAAEEARILFELNRAVEAASDALLEATALLRRVDAERAHLLWSRAVGGARIGLGEGLPVRVCAGRHPLLMEAFGAGEPAAGRAQVVPLDLELPARARVLVVSGPNAGGKSVALKTVGVLCLLAQCGWDVPAREDTQLPLVRRVLADLGDDQSIAQALSSFSAHLGHLKRFLDQADPHTLVLCDEIGSGTDPHEGTALAFGVLERLAAQGATVLASTHFGLLKAAVHDDPRMVNAAMDYDERDLRPLFTFRVGDPGTSHAFDIAARMGLPPDLLERARGRAGQERVQIEQLLADLDRRTREVGDLEARLSGAVADQERLREDLAARLKGLDRERRQVLERAREAGEALLREGRRDIENAVREIRSARAEPPVVRSARDRLAALDERLDAALGAGPAAAPPPPEVAAGQRVRIPHLGLIGRVVEVRGGKLTALADGLRLTVGLDGVEPLDEDGQPAAETDTSGRGSWAWRGEAPASAPEIDLRGERAEEAWERLDRFLDRAIPAGLEVVHVIHGFGTGRLREHLHARLQADPRVAGFGEAERGRGGAGATRVVLAG